MGNAMRARGTQSVPQTQFVPKMTEHEAANGIAAVIVPFSAGQIAKVAGRTKEAAKSWKEAGRCPNTASLINMARALPCVQDWLVQEIGYGARDAQASSVDAVLRGLYVLAASTGSEALKAQQILGRIMQPESQPSPPPTDRGVNVVRDLFAERRRA